MSKRPQRALAKRPIIRILVIWLIEAVAIMLLTFVLGGFSVDSFGTALLAAAAIGLLNALLWPILTYVLLPFAVLTLGLLALVLNGFIIWLASMFVDGFHVASIWTAIWAAFGITAVNMIVSSIFTIDDHNSWYRNVVRRRANSLAKPEISDIPGIIFLEIDGLAEPVLRKAIEAGYAPTLGSWIAEGNHTLVEWETDFSSQTSASQAGILHGSNDNIPAFRWYDRELKEIVASSNPDAVAALERAHSDGNGLLVDNGASRGNLLSGDAPLVSTTASTMKDLSRFHTADFYAFLVNPYNFMRMLLLVGWDIVLEKRQFWQARRQGVEPIMDKHHRGGTYPLLRVFTTIVMRELNSYTLIGDMYSGVSSAYATFVGYDEVAHHSGVESLDAFDVLRKLDEQFARLESVAEDTPRPYQFVVLSDHGQSGGATFLQRYGYSLQDLVQTLAKERVLAITESNEAWAHLNTFLTDVVLNESRGASAVKRLVKQDENGDVELGPEVVQELELDEEIANIIVLASGNLGLVYSTRSDERATLEGIEAFLPGLLEGLVEHPGIGFLMVHSDVYGAVAIGEHGRYFLDEERIEGENPLAGYSPHAAAHLRRYSGFKDAPDIYINSFYDAELNEVAAFEELIGCHGGMGGYQTRPFILYPSEWELDEAELIGAPAVYHQFKRWLNRYQHNGD